VKYLTMNMRICPDARLVANRIARVNGRKICLIDSMSGSKIMSPSGVP